MCAVDGSNPSAVAVSDAHTVYDTVELAYCRPLKSTHHHANASAEHAANRASEQLAFSVSKSCPHDATDRVANIK